MRVSLLYYTGRGLGPWAAADLMIFTKNTRITMSPDGLEKIAAWPEDKKLEELAYMANTIRSSWEFCSYLFMLEGVTRVLTHQLVRHRSGSYAQQTQQVLRIDPTDVEPPRGPMGEAARQYFDEEVERIANTYDVMLASGATVEQARGILPQNVKTNIVVQFSLRTLVDVIHQRVSPRNLGEFRDVAVAMRDAVLEVHPWAQLFLNSTTDRSLAELDEILKDFRDNYGERERDLAIVAMKYVDQVRRGS